MAHSTDIQVVAVELYFLPVVTRVPLKFGPETLTSATCARAKVTVVDRKGRRFDGWGETPLSVQWVWPSQQPYEPRHQRLKDFCKILASNWARFDAVGDPIQLGYQFQQTVLLQRMEESNAAVGPDEGAMPYLAGLVCCSPFDLALHDAFGKVCGRPVYETYNEAFLDADLSQYLESVDGTSARFGGQFPSDYLNPTPCCALPAWHLVGGLDPLEPADLTGDEPNDGYPVLLADWIRTDGLKCLKIKLRGNDLEWDYQRIVRVGTIAIQHGVNWLTTDFNCTVHDPAYVNEILDRLVLEQPRIYGMILYVEQPFPYELDEYPIDVHSTAARKPLFMDESAHDWSQILTGRQLGWTGVALKTCKTQTGAVLSLCWAKSHGMTLMVQDLTNPMLAQIPHVLLAARAGTIMGVETNSMQFYPEASGPEAAVHPGLYTRRNGTLDLSTLDGPGFGYCLDRIQRELGTPAAKFG